MGQTQGRVECFEEWECGAVEVAWGAASSGSALGPAPCLTGAIPRGTVVAHPRLGDLQQGAAPRKGMVERSPVVLFRCGPSVLKRGREESWGQTFEQDLFPQDKG